MGPFLEIACFNAQSAINAFTAGADRIELCDDPSVGGTTPLLKTLQKVRSDVGGIPIHVMVRPRGGDFVYSDLEFDQMRKSMGELGQFADGFVFGILDAHGKVDIGRNTELIKLANNRQCTFHRAFDQLEDMTQGLEHVKRCGFTAILTSGGKPTAPSGANEIASLCQQANHDISIIVGGGVRESNIALLKSSTRASWFHSSALVAADEIACGGEIRGMLAHLRSR
jgi:copper homeostasis protein